MGQKQTAMEKIATFIVDKRNLIFFAYAVLLIFCVIASGWVRVENDLTAYLDPDSETRRGLSVMEEEFVTYGSARVLLTNISADRADAAAERMRGIDGVKSVEFNAKDNYRDAAALLTVTFVGEADDPRSIAAAKAVSEAVSDLDAYISTAVGNSDSDRLAEEVSIILVIAAVIIVGVLLLTSQTFAEVPVLLITFAAAALLGKGTNFLLGKISFVSDSVSVVLQLALSIDYAIMLCHRFSEEKTCLSAREACIAALSKSVPEIFSSSLTTVSGLAALVLMHFAIGRDLATVLIKAIFMSLVTVFTLMPGLLMLFSPLMDKTKHKSFIPPVRVFGRFSIRMRYVMPVFFCCALAASFFFSNRCPYLFSTNLTGARLNETQLADREIEKRFGSENPLALIVPSGDYEAEKALMQRLGAREEVEKTVALSSTEAMDGYMLTDSLTPRQFSELIDVDYSTVSLLYGAYAVREGSYAQAISGLDRYTVPLLDMFLFLYGEVQDGLVTLDAEQTEMLEDLHTRLTDAKLQLAGEHYTRMLLYLDLPEESEETYAFLEEIHRAAEDYYPAGEIFTVGNSTSDRDLAATFETDNLVISIFSIVFVVVILIFTFKSAGLSVLLIAVIQASVWINFSVPYFTGKGVYFLGYLVVSSIQMGANIDYAIVISGRYIEWKKSLPPKEAVIEALSDGFPTVITSGTILAAAGILTGQISTNGIIAALGSNLGRGTVLSILLVIFVLPSILYLGDILIEKTAFTVKAPLVTYESRDKILINGRVRGRVNGLIDAEIHGVFDGELHAAIDSRRPVVERVETEEKTDE